MGWSGDKTYILSFSFNNTSFAGFVNTNGSSSFDRYNPNGILDRTLDLPVSQITCPAFGGEDFNTIYTTTAFEGLSSEDLQKQPLAGRLFYFQTEIVGLAEYQVKLWGFYGTKIRQLLLSWALAWRAVEKGCRRNDSIRFELGSNWWVCMEPNGAWRG